MGLEKYCILLHQWLLVMMVVNARRKQFFPFFISNSNDLDPWLHCDLGFWRLSRSERNGDCNCVQKSTNYCPNIIMMKILCHQNTRRFFIKAMNIDKSTLQTLLMSFLFKLGELNVISDYNVHFQQHTFESIEVNPL